MEGLILVLVIGVLLTLALVIYLGSRRQAQSPATVERNSAMKPNINVAVLGGPGFPGVELSVAMLRVAGGDETSISRLQVEKLDEEAPPTPFTFVEYETDVKHYAHMLLRNASVPSRPLFTGLRMGIKSN